jgi:hypothetical protein
MSAVIIVYPPGAGGNHYKNMLCLDSSFGNSSDLNPNVYSEQTQPPGTVHSIPGRNVHEVNIDHYVANPSKTWIIHGHFGELAPYRDKINSIENKKFLLFGFNTELDQQVLDDRQNRLGHKQHPYYLTEEQPHMYGPAMYVSYFTGQSLDDVLQIPLYEAFHPDLKQFDIIGKLNRFLNVNINVDQAQELHNKWWKLNFYFEWSNFTRSLYGKANTQTQS